MHRPSGTPPASLVPLLFVAFFLATPEISTPAAEDADTSPSLELTTLSAEGLLDPPLSVGDCIGVVSRLQRACPRPGETQSPRDRDIFARALRGVREYLDLRDDIHASLAHFRWTLIKTGGVAPGGTDKDTFTFEAARIPREISALCMEAEGADILVSDLRITDDSGHASASFPALREHPRIIRHSIPRREVFPLPQRTNIRSIAIAYSQASTPAPGSPDPRVRIFAGQTDDPEYDKQAAQALETAIAALDRANWPEVSHSLREANRSMEKLRRLLNP